MRSLLRLARRLERVRSYSEIVRILREEIRSVLGYRTAWIYLIDDGGNRIRLLETEEVPAHEQNERAKGFLIKGDAFLEALTEADRPIVIKDARTDPCTDKEIVARLGNRTIISVPVALEHRLLGAISTGTYGDEGVKVPTQSELDFLQAIARHVAVVVDRVQFLIEIEESESALRASNQRLETALTRLKNAQETLVQRERLAAVGRLTAGIAHDFNNILTGILGSADVVRTAPDTPETAHRYLDRIVKSSQGGAHLVQRLLDSCRKSIHQTQTVDLAPLVEETVEFLRRTVPESTHLDLQIEPGPCLVEADVTQLQQVVTNLVVNARDAMPGGGEVRVILSRQETVADERCAICGENICGAWVRLQVKDRGDGIEPDVLPHIFEPFFTRKQMIKGTGLGLAQVAGIVNQHRGHITVNSQVGEGAVFSVYLPLSTRPEPDVKTPADSSHLVFGDGQTVLVVEDDPAVREIVRDMLESLDYRVLSAMNGSEALAVFAERDDEIDLILTDMVMPDMSGTALLEALRVKGSCTTTVMMSGYPLDDRSARILDKGAVAWIQKPMSLLQLSQTISQALESADPQEPGNHD